MGVLRDPTFHINGAKSLMGRHNGTWFEPV